LEEKVWYIWLSKLMISNNLKLKIIQKLGGIYNFFNASLDDLVDINLSDSAIFKILDKSLKEESYKDFEFVNKNKIEIIGLFDKLYPEKLKKIDEKPVCLYLRGNNKILNDEAVRNSRL
jgi:predicted Rossmann fold nucleotide-binding protein DprA/Smf involved in DNA uptake